MFQSRTEKQKDRVLSWVERKDPLGKRKAWGLETTISLISFRNGFLQKRLLVQIPR